MRSLLIILTLLPVFALTQKRFETIEIGHMISNPPTYDYFCDDEKCDGYCATYYTNGRVKLSGNFADGQIVDSLVEFYSNGQLKKNLTFKKTHWLETVYYENGDVESIYNSKKRYEKEYFSTGQLKKESSWSKKYSTKSKSYFLNGELKVDQGKNRVTHYNQYGQIVDLIKRKEQAFFSRIFAKEYYFRKNKYYKYTWLSYDTLQVLKRKIVLNSYDNDLSFFSKKIADVEESHFEKILLYEDGQATTRIQFKYTKIGSEVVRLPIVYQKESDSWVEQEVDASKRVHEIVNIYTE